MRGVAPLLGVALGLSLAGAAVASHGYLYPFGYGLPTDAQGSLVERFNFDRFLFPADVAAQLGYSGTPLPGPNAELSPNLGLLARPPGVLPLSLRLPTISLLGVLGPQVPLARATQVAAAGASGSFPEGADAGSSAVAMYAFSPAGSGEGAAPASDDSIANQASAPSAPAGAGIGAAWDNASPATKTAIAVGALGLLLFGPLAMYSRIRRDDALQNDTRRRVYELVETSPGVCIKDVAERTGISYSTASYHLDRLLKTDFLVASEQGNRVLYFKNGGALSREDRDLLPILKNEECMRVFNHVLDHPWCYRAEVAQALGVSHTTINWHLKRLIEAALVEEHREGRNCHLFIDRPALQRVAGVLEKVDKMGPAAQVLEPAPIPA